MDGVCVATMLPMPSDARLGGDLGVTGEEGQQHLLLETTMFSCDEGDVLRWCIVPDVALVLVLKYLV